MPRKLTVYRIDAEGGQHFGTRKEAKAAAKFYNDDPEWTADRGRVEVEPVEYEYKTTRELVVSILNGERG